MDRERPGLRRGGDRTAGREQPSRAGARRWIAGSLCALWLATGCLTTTTTERRHLPELQTVDYVDLSRYQGTWYEIARFPHRFERGCANTTASYELRDDGQMNVVNRCRKGLPDGELETIEGRARVVDPATNAKLEVSFFWPLWGDYWIIDLGPSYEYAVVGHPSRDFLWILSRTPTMDEAVYATLVERLEAQGYETERLVTTTQSPRPGPTP